MVRSWGHDAQKLGDDRVVAAFGSTLVFRPVTLLAAGFAYRRREPRRDIAE
jgi:hypothetical protein